MDHSQLPGHGQNCTLAGCVRKLGRRATNQGYHTRGIDDTRLLLAMLPEADDGMLAAKPYTLDVDGLGKVPDLLGGVDGVIVSCVHYTSIVEDDIETSPRVNVFNHSLYIGLLGNIRDLGFDLLGFWDDLL